jgi:hypothetical protein
MNGNTEYTNLNDEINIYLVGIKLAVAAFIGHGFLDFWPLCSTWEWTLSIPYYLLISLLSIYLYLVAPLTTKLLFFVTSAYHFGSDWAFASNALFLGITLVGIGMGTSSEQLKLFGLPDSHVLSLLTFMCGIICLIPSIKKPVVWLMAPLGGLGIYGIMFYAIVIHTPRSVYLLANKYGKKIYAAWIIFTMLSFVLVCLFEVMFGAFKDTRDVWIGGMMGILFAHILCTALWRETIKSRDETYSVMY